MEIKIKKDEKRPDWALTSLYCKKCNSEFWLDFEMTLVAITTISEEELEKNQHIKGEEQWDNHYLESNICPNCTPRKSRLKENVSIKMTIKKK